MNRRRTMSLFWQRRARRFVLPIGGLVISGLLLLPIYFTIESSLAPSSSFQALSQSLVPSHFVFSNYRLAFDQESGSIVTSLLIALGAVVLSVGIALPAAYGLTKFGYLKSRAVVSVAIIVLLVTQMGPGGSLTAELSDAAYVDGASEWRTFRSVIAPLAVPGIVTAGLFVFLFAWGDFLYAYTLTAGGNVTPLTKGILSFFTNNTVNWGGVLATVVLAAIPSGLILSFGQRYVMGGLRAGALKG